MNKKILRLTIFGIIFVSVLGFFSHFIYELSGNNYFAGLVTPINESVWEHMKLIFFPMLLFSGIAKLFSKNTCIGTAFSKGIIFGTLLVPVLFYTYSGAIGYNISYIDISIFFISVAAAFMVFFKNSVRCSPKKADEIYPLIVFIILVMFLLFTYNPPKISLFESPEAQGNQIGLSASELYETKNRVVNYVEQLCVDIFGNQ